MRFRFFSSFSFSSSFLLLSLSLSLVPPLVVVLLLLVEPSLGVRLLVWILRRPSSVDNFSFPTSWHRNKKTFNCQKNNVVNSTSSRQDLHTFTDHQKNISISRLSDKVVGIKKRKLRLWLLLKLFTLS